jgi:hypothetical protein
MDSERSSEAPARESDQEIKDRRNMEMDAAREERAKRLGHDIRREEPQDETTQE